MEHVDVLIVGAGLSGIGAAHHLQERLPHKTYAIFEARDAIGGTWDLFRYPGVRSDSDMFTLGYRFRPWVDSKALADGPSILDYVRDTAREAGIDRRVRFGHRVRRASWSSDDARWTVRDRGPAGHHVRLPVRLRRLLPLRPGLPARVRGRRALRRAGSCTRSSGPRTSTTTASGSSSSAAAPPRSRSSRRWPRRAAHVTMLQRSPTYILSIPSVDPIANALRKLLGAAPVLSVRALEERR